jgi:hypothetical protein
MKRNPINKYNLRSNSERTNNLSSSLEGAHWNDDIDEDDDVHLRSITNINRSSSLDGAHWNNNIDDDDDDNIEFRTLIDDANNNN